MHICILFRRYDERKVDLPQIQRRRAMLYGPYIRVHAVFAVTESCQYY